MIINLKKLMIGFGIVVASYLIGFITVWNGPFSWNRERAAQWPASNIEWGLHFPLLGLVLFVPLVVALPLLVTDRNRKIGFGMLALGCILNNGWLFLSLRIHD